MANCILALATLGALGIWVAAATVAHAQFRPIPNYVGIGAGAQFRNDINNHLSGAAAVAPRIVSLPVGQLPTEQDGQEYWCSDCKQTNPCLGGGQGALVVGMQGQWNCLAGANGTALGGFPLGGNVSAATHTIQNLATDAATGDALSRGQSTMSSLAVPTAAVPMNTQRLTGLGTNISTGDALSQGQSTLNSLASPTAPFAMANQPLSGLPAAAASGQAIAYGQSGAQLTVNRAGAFVSEGDNGNGSGTSNVIPAPANIVSGNALVAVGNWESATAVISFPSGFTALRSDSTTGLTAAWGCKIATGSEPGSYTLTSTVSAFNAGAIVQLKGVTCSMLASSENAANAASVTTAGFTVAPNSFVVSEGSFGGNTNLYPAYGQNLIPGGRGGLGAAGFVSPTGVAPSSSYSIIGGATNFLVSQIALQAATTVQSAPLVTGQTGAQLGSLTANVNNVLNVMAPPYNAQGDGNTDDLPAIQQAVYDACGLPNPPTGSPLVTATKAVYLPAPPVSYMHSAPIRIPCKGLEFYGSGGSKLSQNYFGHAIVQMIWGDTGLVYDASLVTGPGHSLDSTQSLPQPQVIDAGRLINAPGSNNLPGQFGSGFNIAVFVKHTATGGILLASSPSYPGTGGSGGGAFEFTYGGGDSVTMTVNTTGGVVTIPTCASQTEGTIYELELDWDGATYRGWQGVPGGTAVSCGTQASSNHIVQSPFEVIMLPPHGRAAYWPIDGQGGVDTGLVGSIDSVRFERGSVHTTAYTVPSVKFSADSNTFFLTNFENPLDGTNLGYTYNGTKVYSSVTSNNVGYAAQSNIHDLDLCGGNTTNTDGLWAIGANDSIWKNLNCSNAYYSQFDFAENDYYARAENLHGFGGHYGINYGGAFNGSMAMNNGVDETDIACFIHEGGGGGAFEDYHDKCVNRGTLRYGWIEDQSSANYFYPDMDMEAGATNFVASVLLNSPSGYYFYGAGLAASNGTSFIQQDNGGLGSTFIGAHFGVVSATPSYIINYTNGTPTSPTQLINTVNPAGVPLSNQAGNPNILVLGSQSVIQALELQQVPKFDAGVAHLIVNPIADPAAATISVVGGTASTAYGPYFVVCHDSNGGVTLPSASSNTVADGPASLSGSNYINIAWSAVTGCATWDVLKNSTGLSLALGVAGTSYNDIGGSTSAYTAPTRNSTGDISGLAHISTGTTFAKLPGTVVNGMRVYCSNCDPPANPPVICTSAGARTGAFADGVNNQWLCAP